MRYCVVIKMSKRRITFLYARDDNKNGLVPFDGNKTDIPFAILRSNDGLEIGDVAVKAAQTGSADAYVDVFEDVKRPGEFVVGGEKFSFGKLPLLAIERQLRDHLSTLLLMQSTTFDKAKDTIPVGFIFDDCLTDDEQMFILNLFANNGYANVGKIDYNAFLLGRVMNHPKVMIISGDGRDLSCKLYDRESAEVLAHEVMPGMGADPRVEVAAEIIWKQVLTSGELKRDKVMPVLREEAQRFLDRKTPEYEGTIQIEGLSREYFIRRKAVENGMAMADNSRLLPGIMNFIDKAKVQKNECSMILAHSLASNVYFTNTLSNTFPEMIPVDDKWEKDVMKAIQDTIASNDYKVAQLSGADAQPGGGDSDGIVADEIPVKNIKADLSDTSITFNIEFPEGARYVEIYRDGEFRKKVSTSRYTDTGLQVENAYKYRFVAVFIDQYGKQLRTRGRELTYHTIPVVLPDPVMLAMRDEGVAATLKWGEPESGIVKVYSSDRPFAQKENERVLIDEMQGTPLDTLDKQYTVRKDFTGERFFMPVTIVNEVAIAGNQVCVESMVMPDNVRVENVNGQVSVAWAWKDLQAVRIRWQAAGDEAQHRDLLRRDGSSEREPKFTLPPMPKASEIEMTVTSIYTKADGKLLESKGKTLTVSMKAVNVQFVDVKKKRGDSQYQLTLKADGMLPCGLLLLAKEGSDQFDLAYDRAVVTVKADLLKPNAEFKTDFSYKRSDEYEDLHFCLVTADEELDGRVNISPSKRKIDALPRPVETAPKIGEGGPTTPVQPPKESHTMRNLIVLLVLCGGLFLAYKFLAGEKGSQDPQPPTEIDYTSVKVEPSELSLTEGETAKLTVVGEPVDASEPITWSSKNTDVADVSFDGVVTAKKAGQVDIEGTTQRSGKPLKASVKVKKGKTPGSQDPEPKEPLVYTSISASPTSVTLNVGESRQIQLSCTPAKAKETISWASSDSNIATVTQNGYITAKSAGRANIFAVGEKSGVQSNDIHVKVNGGGTVGGNGGTGGIGGTGGTGKIKLTPVNKPINIPKNQKDQQ